MSAFFLGLTSNFLVERETGSVLCELHYGTVLGTLSSFRVARETYPVKNCHQKQPYRATD